MPLLPQDRTILQALLMIAWADGQISPSEREMIEQLLTAYDPTDAEAAEVLAWIEAPHPPVDLPLQSLSTADRQLVLNHAVVLSRLDGEVTDRERHAVETLGRRLGFNYDTCRAVVAAVEARTRRLVTGRESPARDPRSAGLPARGRASRHHGDRGPSARVMKANWSAQSARESLVQGNSTWNPWTPPP